MSGGPYPTLGQKTGRVDVESVERSRGFMGNEVPRKLEERSAVPGATAFEKHYRIGDLASVVSNKYMDK